MKQNCNMLVNEEPRYKISLKKGYRILYIVMSIFFLGMYAVFWNFIV